MANTIQLSMEMSAEHMQNIFGERDSYIRKIENDLDVTIINRDGVVKITGDEYNAKKAVRLLSELTELSKRGNTIKEQNVDYGIAMTKEDKSDVLLSVDSDCICHTMNGKAVKPMTLGQKEYVDAIRKNMIVFGLGPAGTGKTYLAVAAAVAEAARKSGCARA